jgi:hypothetical protein
VSAFAAEIVWAAGRRIAVVVNYVSLLRGVKAQRRSARDAKDRALRVTRRRAADHHPEGTRDVGTRPQRTVLSIRV